MYAGYRSGKDGCDRLLVPFDSTGTNLHSMREQEGRPRHRKKEGERRQKKKGGGGGQDMNDMLVCLFVFLLAGLMTGNLLSGFAQRDTT